jgi:hypothetical protein
VAIVSVIASSRSRRSLKKLQPEKTPEERGLFIAVAKVDSARLLWIRFIG